MLQELKCRKPAPACSSSSLLSSMSWGSEMLKSVKCLNSPQMLRS
jgi:hypothetical protein